MPFADAHKVRPKSSDKPLEHSLSRTKIELKKAMQQAVYATPKDGKRKVVR
jgi:hypothetical protein